MDMFGLRRRSDLLSLISRSSGPEVTGGPQRSPEDFTASHIKEYGSARGPRSLGCREEALVPSNGKTMSNKHRFCEWFPNDQFHGFQDMLDCTCIEHEYSF